MTDAVTLLAAIIIAASLVFASVLIRVEMHDGFRLLSDQLREMTLVVRDHRS